MKRVVAALALAGALGLPTLAGAQDITGNYRVEGTNLDGSPYEGYAVITATSENTCRINWETGSSSSGICMRNRNALAAGYAMGDSVGLVVYEIKPDGTLEGLWTVADTPGVGTERLIPAGR